MRSLVSSHSARLRAAKTLVLKQLLYYHSPSSLHFYSEDIGDFCFPQAISLIDGVASCDRSAGNVVIAWLLSPYLTLTSLLCPHLKSPPGPISCGCSMRFQAQQSPGWCRCAGGPCPALAYA